ncbi:MAG: hypothetical protein KKC18_13250 [Chloroflexi bacterium]|nr:hypothetical protein [Chloroflexota bacterium]
MKTELVYPLTAVRALALHAQGLTTLSGAEPAPTTDVSGRLVQCSDVIELNLVEPRPNLPHIEDWLTDFVHRRPARHLCNRPRVAIAGSDLAGRARRAIDTGSRNAL